MQPAHFLPPDALAPYICFYGITEVDNGFTESYVSPPLGLCGFILALEGEVNARVNGNLFMKDKYCATGQVTAPVIGEIIDKNKTLMVFIQPFGLHQLFGIDMSTLTNTSMPLSLLIGKEEADVLIERLVQSSTHDKMIQEMNDFLLSQLPAFEIAPEVKHALDYIHQQKGSVSVKDVERNCYITSRSLERHFKVCIGLTPKDYAKIYRFKCLMNFIREHPAVTWAELCEQNGYYDQAHLTRYFTRFMKIKPSELVHTDMDFINYLLQD